MRVSEKKIYTYDDLDRLPSEGWYEVIDGEVVELAPTGFEHGDYEFGIGLYLKNKLKGKGYVVGGEVGIIIKREPLRIRAADIIYISKERLKTKPKGMLEVPPELVVEIVSEGNTYGEIEGKVKDYLEFGVDRVLVIDPQTQLATLYLRENKTARIYSFEEEFEVLEGVSIKIKDLIED